MRSDRRIVWVAVLAVVPLLLAGSCLAPLDGPDEGVADVQAGVGEDGSGVSGGGSGGVDPALVSVGCRLLVEAQGAGAVDPSGGTFKPGANLVLTATPAPGWRFDHWEGDLTGGPFDFWRDRTVAPANPAGLVMDGDKTVKGVFLLRQVEGATFDLGGGVTMKLIEIPGGTFTMGSSDAEQVAWWAAGVDFADEGPQHQVTVSSFAMSETEITQAQLRALMGFVPTIPADCTRDCFNGMLSDDRPVGWISWNQAVAFCDALSTLTGRLCRLPTEAEWEYACRAGSAAPYTFGDDVARLGEYAWYDGNSGWPSQDNSAHAVAQKLPNAFGLYDMHGNVWEWVGDWYGRYTTDVETDPTGPSTDKIDGPRKVLRGGAYSRQGRYLRSAYRYDPSGPDGAQFNFGFRVVCE